MDGRDGDKVAIVKFPRSGGPPLIYTLELPQFHTSGGVGRPCKIQGMSQDTWASSTTGRTPLFTGFIPETSGEIQNPFWNTLCSRNGGLYPLYWSGGE
jgi:hypothetical protein